jgi:hypothetical protein
MQELLTPPFYCHSMAFVAVNDPLPEELTLTELILRINVRPTDGGDNSNSRQNHPPPSSDSRSSRPPQPDSHPQPLWDFCTRTDTQCVCGRWGHSVENYQQLAMYFLLAKHLKKDANLTSSSLVSERWRFANEQQSRSAHSTVRAIRAMLPEEMVDRTDDEILE